MERPQTSAVSRRRLRLEPRKFPRKQARKGSISPSVKQCVMPGYRQIKAPARTQPLTDQLLDGSDAENQLLTQPSKFRQPLVFIAFLFPALCAAA